MPLKIAIIGGGFSGCSAATQLAQRASEPLDIDIFEPRERLGEGVAYSADDSDHRLNGPTFIHALNPEDPDGLHRWYLENDKLSEDPDAEVSNGHLYIRRKVFGDYIAETMEGMKFDNASRSKIKHIRDHASKISKTKEGFDVDTENNGSIEYDLVIVTTGNQSPKAPAPFDQGLAEHPAFYESPWALEPIRQIDKDAHILIIGVGLTMADIVATLQRQGHSGKITAFSRSGHHPQTHILAPQGSEPPKVFDEINAPKPAFLSGSLVQMFHAFRREVQKEVENGKTWRAAFDAVRDSVWQVWPNLSQKEQRQFQRHLRRWYDSHRFRLPPQTEKILADAEASGHLNSRIAFISDATAKDAQIVVTYLDKISGEIQTTKFDAIINCTGPSENPTRSSNSIYASLLEQGLASAHHTNIGFAVDEFNRSIGTDGNVEKGIFIFGPPTLGTCGDPLGSPFIAAQIQRALPLILD